MSSNPGTFVSGKLVEASKTLTDEPCKLGSKRPAQDSKIRE